MGSLFADPLKPSLRSASVQVQEMRLVGDQDIIESVYKRMKNVTDYLYRGLEDVYSSEDRLMLENILKVLDLERILQLTKERTTAVVVQQEVSKFIGASEFIDQDYEVKYEEVEMRTQYRDFVEKVTKIGKQKDSEKLSSLEVMVILMNTNRQLWKGCEAVMDILCQAATMKSVEAVVESWVSVLEHHSSKSRPLTAETIQSEMMISINGPLIQHSPSLVEDSMKLYWGRLKTNSLQSAHFTRRQGKVKVFTVSKSVDGLNSQEVKTPFML